MKSNYAKVLSVLFAGAAISACNTEAPKQEEAKVLTSGLVLENMDTTVSPGDNFQMYVNGSWLDKTEIPSDKSSYGVFQQLRDQSQEAVKNIIEEAAKSENAKGSDEQKIGDLYASYMNMEKRNEVGISPVQAEFAKIDAIKDKSELSAYFGYANRKGFSMPLGLFVYSDFKDPNVYSLYAGQSGLGLPDREYYLEDSPKMAEIRSEYVAHIAKMFELAQLPADGQTAEGIMELETALAKIHWKKEDTRNMQKLYNKFSIDSLDQLMSDVDFKQFLAEAKAKPVEDIIVTTPSAVIGVSDVISNTELATIKNYLKWKALNEVASRLTSELDEQNFNFYSKTLSGVKEQRPMWRRAVSAVNGSLGEVIGRVYVSKHFSPEAKERMLELVQNLLGAYEASINDLEWMSAETKMQALDKLKKFTPKIGYPDKWKDYSALEIERDDLYGNLQRAGLVEYDKDMAKIGEKVDRAEWGMTPQTVNAYYNPTMNEIVFPAAILQPPFFDMNADDAVNYGAIGGVIGHEIGHGFDDQGSTFDGDGVLRNWWTEHDMEEFKKRTGSLVSQYNSFEVMDDLHVNGEFTLGENIGDLGGLSIALKAYQMSLGDKEAPVMDGFTGTQRVFMGWAQCWKAKYREEALRTQVKTDPHSPALFRVNGVVRNIPEFYEAFAISEGDSLYLPEGERVKIW
ncbi:M13-type metalloendopeptidase [Limibacter armeniacum]|uniref:M13 family metallopeptidase n=1 Tax=Limibacter armeniacum TaxID=466084 RepID=UPI002FE6A791